MTDPAELTNLPPRLDPRAMERIKAEYREAAGLAPGAEVDVVYDPEGPGRAYLFPAGSFVQYVGGTVDLDQHRAWPWRLRYRARRMWSWLRYGGWRP